ncbi:MAG: stage III sporulation protein AA [Firmicutes bacterium]|nr:stage III sporulation protein AA [Bacillota bacterium]
MSNNFIRKRIENKSSTFNKVLNYLDPNISSILNRIPEDIKDRIEEIRIRSGKPLMICMEGSDFFINRVGKPEINSNNVYITTEENVAKSFQIISNYSVYAIEDELKNGFITIKGGHRVGVSGKVVYGKNGLETIKNISSLNVRIAREKIGVSNTIMQDIIKELNTIHHTLIVSPPQCGKTTLLRDIIRNLSNGMPNYNFRGIKVGLVDERSEIASLYNGQPQNNIGVRTDVLDGCKKYDGMILLIRSMSPHVIATDELGDEKDIKAIHEALKAGVKVIATAHGEGIEDIKTKPNLKEIIEEKIFERIFILDNSNGVGTIRHILDGKTFKPISRGERKNYVSIKNTRKLNSNNFF